MDLFKIFRSRPPIPDAQALADFVDSNAAFLVQKGIYEYSRARAGHYAKVLFSEAAFKEAVEESRWRAFPLGLAMVAEVAENALYPHWRGGRSEGLGSLERLMLSVFDRYPVPPQLGADTWRSLRDELQRRLQRFSLHGPKRAFDVAEPYAEEYFNLMPIHEKLRGRDFWTLRNYLRVTLCNIHDEFAKRADAPALAAALRRQAA
jgi:hypothetical protein